MKRILVVISVFVSTLISAPVFATDGLSSLFISAFNAGYKDDASSQNYDFIELARLGTEPLSLDGFELRYFNSSGNLAGTIVFSGYSLQTDRLVLGFKNSPQYVDFMDTPYQYYFSSSGLASTAGALQIWFYDELVDDVCWGKAICNHFLPKFTTTAADNYSYLRQTDGSFLPEIYHPEINIEALSSTVPPPEPTHCGDLIITEIYSYYRESAAEQFIELYNPTANAIQLDLCYIKYKSSQFSPSGQLAPEQYYLFQDSGLLLTKDPSTFNTISITDSSGDILIDFIYPHGQKKGTSYALFNRGAPDEKWLQTFLPTPGAENQYQQFQTCPDGKEINPETGNCVKSQETAEATICPEGKYLNPLTGRCKKIETTTIKICQDGYHLNILTGRCNKDKTTSASTECKEGYERNPDTGRCRKIRTNTAQEYPVTPSSEEETYDSPQIFVAGGAIIALLLGGIGFALFQFRKEIKTAILKICRRNAS